MDPGIALIAGLGNPGAEYADTRHNAGFRFLERVSREFRREARFHGHAARVRIDEREVWLLAPDTYMNDSGRAVAALVRYYKIAPASVLVVHDELDLAPGDVRLKRGGGAGGHNGLIDIIDKLGTPDFLRLRIGIGRPRGPGVDYVLSRPTRAEQTAIDAAIERAVGYLPALVRGDTQKAMSQLNSGNPDGI